MGAFPSHGQERHAISAATNQTEAERQASRPKEGGYSYNESGYIQKLRGGQCSRDDSCCAKKTSQGAKDYLHKEDYGKIPKYLGHIKQDIDAEYEYIRQLQAQEEEQRNSNSRLLGDEEKHNLIQGLKAKWEQINTDYQAITHLTVLDTMGKVRRNEKYEADLAQTEKDIEKLNRKNIYVDNCT